MLANRTAPHPHAPSAGPTEVAGGVQVATRERQRADILRYRPVAALLRSRWYPGVFQVVVAAVFVIVGWQLLLGPTADYDNLGTALMWIAWWPLIPVAFLLFGRFWCAVCPFGALSDLVQRWVGAHRPVPRFLKRYGVWIIDAAFLAITWSDHVWGVVASPWGSGVLVLLLITAVVASGALFQRRTFCRYLCFLGGLAGNYSRAGMIELRADTDICVSCTSRAACFNGTSAVPACPVFEFPRTMDTSANCILCANCVKSCPNDAITITVRPPTRELWSVRTPQLEASFLAAAIMGIVLIQNVTMLGVWNHILSWTQRTTGMTNYPVIFTMAFIAAIAAPVGGLALAAKAIANAEASTFRNAFAAFGYALIPLDMAAHIAHNLFHLLAEGKALGFTAMGVFGHPHELDMSTRLASTGTIRILQYVLLAFGVIGSLYVAWRTSARRTGGEQSASALALFGPVAVLIAILATANVWLFMQPMMMRM